MRNRLFLVILGSWIMVPPAFAQGTSPLNGLYLGLAGGAAWIGDQSTEADFGNVNNLVDVDIEHDVGYQIAGRIGYVVQTNIRLEGEIAYSSHDAERTFSLNNDELEIDQELSILSGTVGVFFDLWPVGSFVPYIGGGIGYANVEVKSDNDLGDVDQNVFTAFAEGGLPFNVTPELSIAPSVRFNWYGTEEETDGEIENGLVDIENVVIADDLYSTQLRLGLRYVF